MTQDTELKPEQTLTPSLLRQVVALLVPRGLYAPATDSLETYLEVSHRDDLSRWGMPGGKIEPGETAQQAILREAWEELGLEVPAVEVVPLMAQLCKGDGPYETCWVTTYLWVRAAGSELAPLTMEKGLASAWHSEAQMCNPRVTPYTCYHREMFQAYRRFLGLASF